MALEKFTGKSATSTLTVGGTVMPGWRDITVTENGAALPTPVDVTAAQDAAYAFVDDPLGGDQTPSCSVDVSGLLSITDQKDGSGWFALTKGNTYTVIVKTKTGGDEWTQANMVFKEFTTGAGVAEAMPFTAKFSYQTAAGAWATDVG